MTLSTQARIERNRTNANQFNAHENDAAGFHFNGAARLAAMRNPDPRVPVRLVDGDQEPRLEGSHGGWFTNGGTRILHPTSYAKHGWSNMTYVCDSRCVVVGRDWRPELAR